MVGLFYLNSRTLFFYDSNKKRASVGVVLTCPHSSARRERERWREREGGREREGLQKSIRTEGERGFAKVDKGFG